MFIMDESNVLDSGFLERINTLLANGEVPGLFEGDEYITLCTQIKVIVTSLSCYDVIMIGWLIYLVHVTQGI